MTYALDAATVTLIAAGFLVLALRRAAPRARSTRSRAMTKFIRPSVVLCIIALSQGGVAVAQAGPPQQVVFDELFPAGVACNFPVALLAPGGLKTFASRS